MDPKANITEQVELAQRIVRQADDDTGGIVEPDALRLAELVLALDEWRRKGGFDPYVFSLIN